MSKSQSHDDVSQSKALLGDAEPYSAPLNDAGGGRKTTKSSSHTRNGKPALWPSLSRRDRTVGLPVGSWFEAVVVVIDNTQTQTFHGHPQRMNQRSC